jgi:tetratricopeptide (TPR) repeat protein
VAYLVTEAEKHEAGRNPSGVLIAAREAASSLKRLLKTPIQHRNTCCQLAYLGFQISTYLRRAGEAQEALVLCEDAKCTLNKLIQEAPKECHLFYALSSAWNEVAKLRWDMNQPELTLAACRNALEAQRQAFSLAPGVPAVRQTLSMPYFHLGRKLCELGRLDEAEACFREPMALWNGDSAKRAEVLQDLRQWAAQVGKDRNHLTSDERQERQRYLDLCKRLQSREVEEATNTDAHRP